MKNLKVYLTGSDLRSIGAVDKILPLIKNQKDFDDLFRHLFFDDRIVKMRAADAVEKITLKYPDYLTKHKSNLLNLIESAKEKEFKWHLALLVTRVKLTSEEMGIVSCILIKWTKDKNESKIVRVNSLQSLYELSRQNINLERKFVKIIKEIDKENIHSLKARIKRLNYIK